MTPTRAPVVAALLLAVACGPPGVAELPGPTASLPPAPAPATLAGIPSTVAVSPGEQLATSLTGGQLDAWGSMAATAIEWGDVFTDLDDLIDSSSAIFIGQVSAPPERRVFEDTETDDAFVYSVVPILVESPLGGRRSIEPGTTVQMVDVVGFPDELIGSRVVWFLVNARDTPNWTDEPGHGVDGHPGEADIYRWSPMAVWVDRGDGVPVAPVSEAERMPPSEELEEFVFDDAWLPDETFHLANLQARELTMSEFLDFVIARSEHVQD